MSEEMSLFPLGAVLFPGGPLALKIFEPRYLDMVSACLRYQRPFGVCLIKQGQEVGEPAEPFNIGTSARILDWDRSDDGLLTITAQGQGRFRILHTQVGENDLLVGRCESLPEKDKPLPPKYQSLAQWVVEFMEKSAFGYEHTAEDINNANWVSYRFAEVVPLPMQMKQQLLELEDPLARLEQLFSIVERFKEQSNV